MHKCFIIKTSPTRSCSIKKVLLKIFENSRENIFDRVSFLKNLIKIGEREKLREFCEIDKTTNFKEYLRTATMAILWRVPL